MSFKSSFWALKDAGCSGLRFGIYVLIWIWLLVFNSPMIRIFAIILDLKVQRTSMSLKSWFRASEDAGDSWLELASWSWFGYGHWSLTHPWSKFQLSILILKVQRTSMSFKSSFGALEDAGGSWVGFAIFILIWICPMVFGTPIFWILAPYLDFEGEKTIHVL